MVQPYKYLNSDNEVIIRIADNLRFYPEDNAAYLSWAAIPGNAPDPADPPVLADVQAVASAAIDAQAGATRAKYITVSPGQSETYQAKATDAAAYKAAGYPSASIANYPWVRAEGKAMSGATPTAAQYQAAADGIVATAAAWVTLGAAIEQARRAGKIAVGIAVDATSAQAAQAAAIAALQAL